MIHRRTLAGLAATGAVALALATTTAANASASERTGSSDRGNGTTTVVLNPTLVPVLVNALKVEPVAPGQLSAPSGVAQVSFPITRVSGGVVHHVGGLQFAPVGGGQLKITQFDVNLNTGYLTAKTRLGGKTLRERVNIFALGPAQPINGMTPSCAGVQAGLTLTSDAAAALGAPSFTGAFVGDACVVPATHNQNND